MTDTPQDRSYRALFRVPSLGRILVSMQVARTAQSMLSVTLILFTLAEYDSPGLAGLVTFAAIFPGLIVSPIAGALLDRHGRVRLVVLDYVVVLVALALIAGLAVAGMLPAWLLVLIALVSSVTGLFSHSGLRSSDPKHDEIEAAIRSIPFNGATSAPAASTAKAVATKEGAAKAGRSPFDGVWHTVRKHGGCCGYSASEDIAFATDASGMTTSAGTFLGDARGKVTGTSLPLDYGIEKNVPSGHVTLELGGDGKGFLGNFRDKNNHHGTISGSR